MAELDERSPLLLRTAARASRQHLALHSEQNVSHRFGGRRRGWQQQQQRQQSQQQPQLQQPQPQQREEESASSHGPACKPARRLSVCRTRTARESSLRVFYESASSKHFIKISMTRWRVPPLPLLLAVPPGAADFKLSAGNWTHSTSLFSEYYRARPQREGRGHHHWRKLCASSSALDPAGNAAQAPPTLCVCIRDRDQSYRREFIGVRRSTSAPSRAAM